MKLVLKHSEIAPAKAIEARVRKHLGVLEPLRKIDEAIVHLARERESSPPFRVHVHLVTPGPDVIAEARDHTLGAALRKVVRQLAQVIADRTEKRHARLRNNLQAPAYLARSSSF